MINTEIIHRMFYLPTNCRKRDNTFSSILPKKNIIIIKKKNLKIVLETNNFHQVPLFLHKAKA